MEVEGAVERQVGATVQEEFNVDQKPQNNGCFDCNICLDYAADPVVTLCGHLYCWPCIYKWLQQGAGGDSSRQCPVCKAALVQQSFVPLYGRGQSAKTARQSLDIPRRPSFRRETVEQRPLQLNEEQNPAIRQLHGPRHQHLLDYYPLVNSNGGHTSSPPEMAGVMHSAGGALGGMAVAVLPWMFRNQGWASVYYSSPRVRRQELEVERSLHQISAFLFCCAILCLLLF